MNGRAFPNRTPIILFELRVWRSFKVTVLRTVTLRRSPCTRIFRAWLRTGVQVTGRRRWWLELWTSPSALVRNPDLLPVLVIPQATIESKYLSPMPLKPSSKIPPFLQPCLSQARPLFKAVLFIFLSSFSFMLQASFLWSEFCLNCFLCEMLCNVQFQVGEV